MLQSYLLCMPKDGTRWMMQKYFQKMIVLLFGIGTDYLCQQKQ
jgi:hypothetical protein